MRVILLAATLLAAPAAAQSRADIAGQGAGRLLACGAPAEIVFDYWRAANNMLAFEAPRAEERIVAEFLHGMMLATQERPSPGACVDLLLSVQRDLRR